MLGECEIEWNIYLELQQMSLFGTGSVCKYLRVKLIHLSRKNLRKMKTNFETNYAGI